MTLAVPVAVQDANTLTVRNGLTLNSSVITLNDHGQTGNGVLVDFNGTQTLGGTGEVVFAGNAGSNTLRPTVGTLTLAPGIMVHGTQTGFLGNGGLPLILQGMVLADRTGQTIFIRGTAVTNEGTLRAVSGGRLDVSPLSNSGVIEVATSGRIDVANFVNSGTVRVEEASTFFVNGDYTQTAGETILLGGLLDPTGMVRIDGGILSGFGTISGNVLNAGRLELGAPLGTLQIIGSYEQATTGVLAIELGGTTAGLFDRLVVSGSATFRGRLAITLRPGFELTSGDSFEIVTYASFLGGFDLIESPDPRLQAIFDPTRLRLVVL